jgi:hypothetical protein
MEGVIGKIFKHPKAWISWVGFDPGRDGLPPQLVAFDHGLYNFSHTAFSQELTYFHGDEMLGLHFLRAPTTEFDALDGDPSNGLNDEIRALRAVHPDEALVVRPAVLLEFKFGRWLTLDLEGQRLVIDINYDELKLGLGEGELIILPVAANARTFNVIIDTVAFSHPVAPIVNTLKVGGTYVLLGGIAEPFTLGAFPMLFNRYAVEGSLVGGMAETQQMLDFCAEHGIVPECKTIPASEANDYFKAMAAGTNGAIRAVIDMSTLKDL